MNRRIEASFGILHKDVFIFDCKDADGCSLILKLNCTLVLHGL